MKIENEKGFNTALSGFVKSQKTQRDNLQDLIVFAGAHYVLTADTALLAKLANACQGLRSVPTKRVTDYIQAHWNVTLGKDKATDLLKFTKAQKGSEFPAAAVLEVGQPWYIFTQDADPLADLVDPVAVLKAAMKKIKEAMDEGNLVDSRVEKAQEWMELLVSAKVGNYENIPAKDLKGKGTVIAKAA